MLPGTPDDLANHLWTTEVDPQAGPALPGAPGARL